ncbi:splicing factor: arginine/serine-rich 15-like isoform X1 [Leptotrombidium deliense]|uniref:Splicing factor: arginine/serine-rich 15-like isoform X1 n=1 Tax=Leptotrombidium deliense TaxID=299467 RepID=A0A443SUT7_9ACAR|nr:splicing factor: arginine/serine-rich 15-like isoform X1 [Leptotrombidium deliense]
MAWAPGKGMKGKEFKDYWDVDLGASYIPFEKINDDVDLDLLEDGGMIDEETIPDCLKELRRKKLKENDDKALDSGNAMIPLSVAAQVTQTFGVPIAAGMVVSSVLPQTQLGVAVPQSLMGNQPVLSTPPPILNNANPLLTSPQILHHNSLLSESTKNDLNNQTPSSSHSLSHLIPPSPLNVGVKNDSSPNQALQMRPSIPPPLHQTLGVTQLFQPPLSVPPPSVITGQRPPPLPWGALLSTPSPQTLPPFRPPNGSPLRTNDKHGSTSTKYDERRSPSRGSTFSSDTLPPRLHSDHDLGAGTSQRLSTHALDRTRDRFREGEDDPFAPSMYELKAMERSGSLRPPLIANAPRTPLLPRGYEDMSQRERFGFDRRYGGREWRSPLGPRGGPPGMIRPFEEGVRGPAPQRDWQRREPWRERGNRNDRYSRGNFGRNRDRERDRDRERLPTRWKSPSVERNSDVSDVNLSAEKLSDDNRSEEVVEKEDDSCSNSEQTVNELTEEPLTT